MAEHTNGKLLQLRSTLRALKQSGACEGSFRLSYAVDKTLRNLTADHGNTEAHALEAFEDARTEALEAHAERAEEGHILYEHDQTGALLYEKDGVFYYAQEHQNDQETHKVGARWGGQERAQREARSLKYKIGDREALQEALDELREETTEVEIHQIPAEVLEELDVSNVGRQVDLSILELMEV